MTSAEKMSRVYESNTYRRMGIKVVQGREVQYVAEQVTVPVGQYEDTRLGVEVLDGVDGWELVDPNGTEDEPDTLVDVARPTAETREVVSDANETSSPDNEAEAFDDDSTDQRNEGD